MQLNWNGLIIPIKEMEGISSLFSYHSTFHSTNHHYNIFHSTHGDRYVATRWGR